MKFRGPGLTMLGFVYVSLCSYSGKGWTERRVSSAHLTFD